MVGTHRSGRAEAPTQTERMRPLWAHVGSQVDKPGSPVAVQTVDCEKLWNLEVFLGAEEEEGCHGCRCVLLKELLQQISRLL